MRTLVHLSDLHFGAADPNVTVALTQDINALRPDVIAVSGDLTQRARRRQFVEARAFLQSLPFPQVIVPGNHDVPLYNLAARLVRPLGNFRRYIGDTHSYLADPELVVVGANSTRSFTIKDGGLTARAVSDVLHLFSQSPPGALRVLVCHHPFDRVPWRPDRWAMPVPWGEALTTLVADGTDVILTGHLHVSYAGHTTTRYQAKGRAAIVVEAGTATSVRARGEANAYNVLTLTRDGVSVERREWRREQGMFVTAHRDTFHRVGESWSFTDLPAGSRGEGAVVDTAE